MHIVCPYTMDSCPQVSDSERAEIEEALRVVHAAAWRDSPPKYYKVHWTRVPDLVEKRRVYLRAGTAYVPSMELSSVVFQQFQTDLGRALEASYVHPTRFLAYI